MIILGIDPGLAIVGWAVLDSERGNDGQCGRKRTAADAGDILNGYNAFQGMHLCQTSSVFLTPSACAQSIAEMFSAVRRKM